MMINFSHKGLLVDLDGTIINSLPDRINAIQYMLKKLNYPAIEGTNVQFYIGSGVYELARKTLTESLSLPSNEVNHEIIERAIELYESYYLEHICDESYLYPHVKKTLQILHKQHIAIALITNKRNIHSQKLIESLKLHSFFTHIIGSDDGEKKPAPDLLLIALKRMNLLASDVIMVGDSIDDMNAAKTANVKMIGVSYGYRPLTKEISPQLIDDFSAILPYFLKMNSN